MPAYLVLLPVEIARFTQTGALPRSGWLPFPGLRQEPRSKLRGCAGLRLRGTEHPSRGPGLTRLCCSDPHLAVDSR